jgi:hypothetical protein
VVLALVALGVAGGFGQLGDLSQAFAGPSAPAPVRVAGTTGTTHAAGTGTATVLPVVLAAAPPTRNAATGAPEHGGTAPRVRGHNPQAGIGPVATTGPGTGSTGPGTPGGTGGTPPGGTGGTPPGGTSGAPTLVDSVVGVGTSVTSKLPAPAGSTATGVLQAVGKTVDSALPSNAASPAATSATSAVSGATSAVTGAVNTVVQGLRLQ